MCVNVPNTVSSVHLEKIINNFKKRFKKQIIKRKLNKKQDLKVIAERLNKKYFDRKLKIKSVKCNFY